MDRHGAVQIADRRCVDRRGQKAGTMDKEVALSLLQRFLEKRGVEGVKHIPGLIASGVAKVFFCNPESYFDVEEWRAYGDCLWDLAIDDDKTVKKLMKPWRETINSLKRYKLEQQVAAVATQQLGGQPRESERLFLVGGDY